MSILYLYDHVLWPELERKQSVSARYLSGAKAIEGTWLLMQQVSAIGSSAETLVTKWPRSRSGAVSALAPGPLFGPVGFSAFAN